MKRQSTMLTRQIDSKSGVMTSNEMMAANPHSPVLVKTIDMPKGYIDALHQHTWHQIIFPIKGYCKRKRSIISIWFRTLLRYLFLRVFNTSRLL